MSNWKVMEACQPAKCRARWFHRGILPDLWRGSTVPTYIKKIIHHDQGGCVPEMQGCSNICKSICAIYHKGNHIIILIDVERTSEKKNPTWLHDKSPRECRARGNIPEHNKSYILETHCKHLSERKTKQSCWS